MSEAEKGAATLLEVESSPGKKIKQKKAKMVQHESAVLEDEKKSPDKKKKTKTKKKVNENSITSDSDIPPKMTDGADEDAKKSPTKKKLKKPKNHGSAPSEEISDLDESGNVSLNESDLTTPYTKKKKATVRLTSPGGKPPLLTLNDSKRSMDANGSSTAYGLSFHDSKRSIGGGLLSPGQVKKYSAEYFEAVLEETRGKLDKKIKINQADRDKFLGACEIFYNEWYGNWELEQSLQKLEGRNNADKEEVAEARARLDESNVVLPKMKKKCIKAAAQIFGQLDEEKLESLEDKLVKGAIIAQSGPDELAKFTEEGKENERLIKKLFNDPELMRDMLRFGGPTNYKYGNAMRIYTKCVETMDGGDLDSKWERVNKKIALACALELAAGAREFDSGIVIDPVKRYKHFEEAHRKGELDPAFPHFSVWEMRQIVNCDAPNDQMKWIRDTVMNYAPHITLITDFKLRYTYILESDVRIRKPSWTGQPRTYQMILSGGGNQSINSWFGRFVLRSFGLPVWGAKGRKVEGFCRWTPEGWEAMNGVKWDSCSWEGKTGQDFKLEIEARNKASSQEYWKKLVMLQALADLIDGDPNSIPDYEKDVLHPERLWRSLSIVSMELLFQTKPELQRSFERNGRNLVITRNEKYLEMYELDEPDSDISVKDGIVTIPASRHGFQDGHISVIDSFNGGKQVNFLADGTVEYEMPQNVPKKKYSMKLEVCTVSAMQTPVTIEINDSDKSMLNVVIPYTMGVWDYTLPVEVELEQGSLIRLSRPKGSMGLALKRLILS